jgi:4-hydroxythreonine-4-phosphate dehydrogenase
MNGLPLPPLAVTMGEPAGVGGEIILKAWQQLRESGPLFFALADPDWLARLARGLGLRLPLAVIGSAAAARDYFAEALPVLPLRLAGEVHPGRPDPRHGGAVIEAIERGVAMAQSGEAAGLVTAPVHKRTLYQAGFAHPGHTEFIAALTGASEVAMMLAAPGLRVVPLTIHVPLRAVFGLLSAERLLRTARLTLRALADDFGIPAPRLAVAGLNPHAGEGGELGDEELRLIAPAVAELQAEGRAVSGPHAPDTLFTARARAGYDAALCMYHDQALIPLKTLAMDEGVNVTLGLPIIRTSPDHGTALDIAGRGLADPASLIAALRLAATLAARRRARTPPSPA